MDIGPFDSSILYNKKNIVLYLYGQERRLESFIVVIVRLVSIVILF